VGASTWALGNHKWKGIMGTLIQKERKNKIKRIFSIELSKVYPFKMMILVVPLVIITKTIPVSIINEPNKVYRKN
jgi:hypothetical protein